MLTATKAVTIKRFSVTKFCMQYLTNVQRTNSLFSVIRSLVRFSSAFTFSSFL